MCDCGELIMSSRHIKHEDIPELLSSCPDFSPSTHDFEENMAKRSFFADVSGLESQSGEGWSDRAAVGGVEWSEVEWVGRRRRSHRRPSVSVLKQSFHGVLLGRHLSTQDIIEVFQPILLLALRLTGKQEAAVGRYYGDAVLPGSVAVGSSR